MDVVPAALFLLLRSPRVAGPPPDCWLARAAGLGFYGFCSGAALPFVLQDLWGLLYGGPVALAGLALFAGSVRRYASGKQAGTLRSFLGRTILFLLTSHLVTSATVGIFLPGLIRSPIAANEASATASLRSLNRALEEYDRV